MHGSCWVIFHVHMFSPFQAATYHKPVRSLRAIVPVIFKTASVDALLLEDLFHLAPPPARERLSCGAQDFLFVRSVASTAPLSWARHIQNKDS